MRIQVHYLGGSRVQAGCSHENMDVPEDATLRHVMTYVGQQHPALAPFLNNVRWARNYEFVDAQEVLTEGDEIALIPPVAGGAPSARLTLEPLNPQAVLDGVTDSSMGATVVFVGTVRDHARGKRVTHLDYEAYEPMALRQLERIAEACSDETKGTRVAIDHRYGPLAIGDISVVIAAASPHRAQAFEACRQAIERIKVDVPIWKKEFSDDGEEWVGWGGG